MPGKLEKGQWYEIKGYLDGWDFDDPANIIIFKIDENGKAKKH